MISEQLVSQIAVTAVLIVPAGWFAVAGFHSRLRSRRAANLGLAMGLLVLPLSSVLGLSPVEHSTVFLIGGIVGACVALAGGVLSFWAWHRRGDGGVTRVRPALGIGACLPHLGIATAVLAFWSQLQPGDAWVYESPDFRLTLPSAMWRETRMKGMVVAFMRPVPVMHAFVPNVKTDQAEDDYRREVTDFMSRAKPHQDAGEDVDLREGLNDAGNPYVYWAQTVTSPDGQQAYTAYSRTWCPARRTIVDVCVEGPLQMKSHAGEIAEITHIRDAALRICLSIN